MSGEEHLSVSFFSLSHYLPFPPLSVASCLIPSPHATLSYHDSHVSKDIIPNYRLLSGSCDSESNSLPHHGIPLISDEKRNILC